ncbi:MAG: hypothetical protein ABEJ07_05240 [Candidatus Nanohaloarchaea archaeon]
MVFTKNRPKHSQTTWGFETFRHTNQIQAHKFKIKSKAVARDTEDAFQQAADVEGQSVYKLAPGNNFDTLIKKKNVSKGVLKALKYRYDLEWEEISKAGLPDFLVVDGYGEPFFVELKKEGTGLGRNQLKWFVRFNKQPNYLCYAVRAP